MAKEVIQSHIEVPEGLAGIRMMLGMLQGQIQNLQDELREYKQDIAEDHEEIRDEQRTVHNIVDATNEAIRNVNREVADMRPHVKEYMLAAADLREAVRTARTLRDKQSFDRGVTSERTKTRALVLSALGVIGTGIVYMLTKLVEYLINHFSR